jgi:16S rRNA (cytidine1402-2'-O)-methyltransferase
MMNDKGKLYLIPTTLGDSDPFKVLPNSIKDVMSRVNVFIVENEKTARKHIKQINPTKNQARLKLLPLNKFTDPQDLLSYLDDCDSGTDIGLLSEAGCPGIADPGADIVKLAHEKNIQVIPLVGPSSILLAMMASGMNGQSFAFNGYLPIDKSARKSEIKRLERISYEHNQSQSFIETPYRNNKLLEDLCSLLNDHTEICVACDVTLPTEYIKTLPVKIWKHTKVDLHKRPTMFVLHKPSF